MTPAIRNALIAAALALLAVAAPARADNAKGAGDLLIRNTVLLLH